MSKLKGIGLIEDEFKARGLKFTVKKHGPQEEVLAGFRIKKGPNVLMHWINTDDGSDMAVRVYAVMESIPAERIPRMLEACNLIHRDIRFARFIVDSDGDLNMEYDMPTELSDDCVGPVAYECMIRFSNILDRCYPLLCQARDTDEPLKGIIANDPDPFLRALLHHVAENSPDSPELQEKLDTALDALQSLLHALSPDGSDADDAELSSDDTADADVPALPFPSLEEFLRSQADKPDAPEADDGPAA